MSVYFNDLTLDNTPEQNCLLLSDFWRLMKVFSTATKGREKRVIANDKALSALSNAVCASKNPELQMYFRTFFVQNYSGSDAKKSLESAAEHLLETDYKITLPSGDVKCEMMGWAYHERSLTLGLRSSKFWNDIEYPIKREYLDGDELISETVDAICLTTPAHVETKRIKHGWIPAHRDFEETQLPDPCPLMPDEKFRKVQMHHGCDVMMKFAKRLCGHKYVQGVINNIEFESTTSRFIENTFPDGVVELRMHWTDRGYGLRVQTVARGKAQTDLVADILKAKFDRRS